MVIAHMKPRSKLSVIRETHIKPHSLPRGGSGEEAELDGGMWRGTLLWEYKMVRPSWKPEGQFLVSQMF